MDGGVELYIMYHIGPTPEQASQRRAAQRKDSDTMPEPRTRPARQRERFAVLIDANVWFWQKLQSLEDPDWERLKQWSRLPNSTRIRRFMIAVKNDDRFAMAIYANSSAADADAPHHDEPDYRDANDATVDTVTQS